MELSPDPRMPSKSATRHGPFRDIRPEVNQTALQHRHGSHRPDRGSPRAGRAAPPSVAGIPLAALEWLGPSGMVNPLRHRPDPFPPTSSGPRCAPSNARQAALVLVE